MMWKQETSTFILVPQHLAGVREQDVNIGRDDCAVRRQLIIGFKNTTPEFIT
jgi:hypothetical protein